MISINIKKEFAKDFLSRVAGERLRGMIFEATKSGQPVEIDFDGLVIASTSFFDEGFAKLTELGWSLKKLNQFVQLKNIHPKDKEILFDLFKRREKTTIAS